MYGEIEPGGDILNRMNYYLGDHTVLTNLVHGPMMFLDTRDPVNLTILLTGYWEDWITNVFLSVVKPGMTVLDIGAHHGYFTLLAGMLVGPTGFVHAFEPNPFHHKNLLKSVSYNGYYDRVKLYKVMLSNQRGEEEMVRLGEAGSSIFFRDWKKSMELPDRPFPKDCLPTTCPV
jgi:hypothetical protein